MSNPGESSVIEPSHFGSAVESAAPPIPPSNPKPILTDKQLIARMQALKPWRQNIQITQSVSTENALVLDAESGAQCQQSRSRDREKFLQLIDSLYPAGLATKRFLDCGCNAGGCCFWARERDAELGFGFDVREHWIKQARFIKRHRSIAPTSYIRFEILNLYDLPTLTLDPFDIVQFRGLFYHLTDPIGGLKIAADHARDVLLFSTAVVWGEADGSLRSVLQPCDKLHGSTEKLTWYPTGPRICAELIRQLGFDSIKLTKYNQIKQRPTRGRLELVAAREKNRLDDLPGEAI